MALLPLLNELLDEYRRPLMGDVYDQRFGMGLHDDEVVRPVGSLLPIPFRSGYLRPWRTHSPLESGVSTIHSDKNEMKINLDVQQFKPEDLKVRIADGYIVVEGKHEERSDQHGFVSRQFTRRYKIPQDVDEKAITSNLSSDGVLILKAPKKASPSIDGAQEIPIIQTNQPAIASKTEETKES